MITDRCIFRCRSRVSLCVATGKPSFSQSIWPRASRTSVYSTWGILCRLSFVDHADKWKILHTQHMFFSVADGCICSTPRNQYSLLSGVCAYKYRVPYIQCSRASAARGRIVHFHRSPYKIFLFAGGHRCQFHHIPYNLPSVACEYINCFHHSLYTNICSCCAYKNCWASSACNWISVDHVHILDEYVSF